MTNTELLWLLFGLLVAFQVKHLIADYLLQTKYMLDKFLPTERIKNGWRIEYNHPWFMPLFAHCSVHAVSTYIILTLFGVSGVFALYLATADLIIHFSMDRIKASPDMLGRYKPNQKQFWWSLGLDQGVHHLTHYGIILTALHFELMV